MNLMHELTDDVSVEVKNEASLMRPAFLGHGTMECRDFQKSRPFYEDFLGLECVQHGRRSMAVRLGLKFHVICLQVGESARPLGVNNHWGLDMHSRDEVDRAHKTALEAQEKFGILEITDPVDTHGVYSFYVQDLDSNWWEFQFYEAGLQDEDLFDFGDRFKPDGTPV
jgi:catechol 2,3-dioxygenase-like lactoylglutathione lyase family enzyme